MDMLKKVIYSNVFLTTWLPLCRCLHLEQFFVAKNHCEFYWKLKINYKNMGDLKYVAPHASSSKKQLVILIHFLDLWTCQSPRNESRIVCSPCTSMILGVWRRWWDYKNNFTTVGWNNSTCRGCKYNPTKKPMYIFLQPFLGLGNPPCHSNL